MYSSEEVPAVGAMVAAERVRVSILSAPVDGEVPMSFASLRDRRTCLVEIDAEGVTGVGESWINYPGWAHDERIATLRDGVIPLLFGRDISDPRAVFESMVSSLGPVGRQWGAPGPIWQAISAIDLALWDLKGKLLGKPVSRLLAEGALRTSVSAYGSGVGPDRVEDWCHAALEQELRAVKVRLGFDRDQDTDTLARARSVLEPGMTLLGDANQAWNLEQAVSMLDVLHDFDVGWIEEPIAGDSLRDLVSFAEKSRVPLATGENLYGIESFDSYLGSGAVAIVQPDVTKCGGISATQDIVLSARRNGVVVAPHCYGSAVGIAASLHVAAASPETGWVELDIRPNPLRTDLLTSPLRLEQGSLVVPSGAGFGVELDGEVLEKYRTHLTEFLP